MSHYGLRVAIATNSLFTTSIMAGIGDSTNVFAQLRGWRTSHVPALFRIRGELTLELRAGAIQAAHHRADFHALLIGHLLVGLAVDGGVDEHLPAFRREFGERGHDFPGAKASKYSSSADLSPSDVCSAAS